MEKLMDWIEITAEDYAKWNTKEMTLRSTFTDAYAEWSEYPTTWTVYFDEYHSIKIQTQKINGKRVQRYWMREHLERWKF